MGDRLARGKNILWVCGHPREPKEKRELFGNPPNIRFVMVGMRVIGDDPFDTVVIDGDVYADRSPGSPEWKAVNRYKRYLVDSLNHKGQVYELRKVYPKDAEQEKEAEEA